MKKLLGLLLCLGMCAVIGFGSVGCSKKDSAKKDDAKKDVAKKDVAKKDNGTKDNGTKDDAKKGDDKKGEDKKGEETKASVSLAADPVEIALKDKKGKGQAKITATRKNADEEITLKFSAVAGVEFKNGTIAKGENSSTVDVIATEKASAGDYDVTVTGTAGKATVESTKLKLKIK